MRIVKNGDVHVSAPIGMPKKEVERFIEEHREWIAEARKKTYECTAEPTLLCTFSVVSLFGNTIFCIFANRN